MLNLAQTLAGPEFRLLVMMSCAAVAGLGVALLILAASARGSGGRWITLTLALVALFPALVAIFWHVASQFQWAAPALGAPPVVGYAVCAAAFIFGYFVWLMRSDYKAQGQEAMRLGLATASAFIIGGSVAFGLLMYLSGSEASPTRSGAAPSGGGFGDSITLLGVALAVLTGITVQYITQSLHLVNEQRKEIADSVESKKRLDEARSALKTIDYRMGRTRFYEAFSDRRLDQVLRQDMEWSPELIDYKPLMRVFQEYESPRDATEEFPPQSLQDIYQALSMIAGNTDSSKAMRRELRQEHGDSIRDFHRRIKTDTNLSAAARTRFDEIMNALDAALEADRRHG